ncbi:hypothetical protein [Streptomyces sp. WZ-12]|uniref:hypothetical protein n=1 Tax=Streptomyces sp. WZ-12 TaxID=3030210 RepID=UPI002381593D|nr:hypothetical protein [Streptomyces sp. WZ-12]
MEPRELWERHAVLAQAFCISDDEVRRTQGLLDEAEARRSRTLAAFAVTVGSDEVVADLLGLDTREVRLARRTVGKEDARAVAKSLLDESARERRAAVRPEPARPTSPPVVGIPTPPSRPRAAAPVPPAAAPAPPPEPAATRVPPRPAPSPHLVSAPVGAPLSEPGWSPALDAVLVHSHHTGADLTALASELGLDVTILNARAHQLAAESSTSRSSSTDRIGRHRRMTEGQPAAPSDPGHFSRAEPHVPPQSYEPHTTWAPAAHPTPWAATQDAYASWSPPDAATWSPQPGLASAPTWDPSAMTVAQHDWDGILSQWEATTAPYTSSPGQQSP